MKHLRYRWLLWRGYEIEKIVAVRHIDNLFSDPPVVYRRSSKLVMRHGFSTRTIRFRRLTVEQLRAALLDSRANSSSAPET